MGAGGAQETRKITAMIRLNDISIALPGHKKHSETILAGVTLEIARGDWVTLAGPNGSGKTTLLKALAGIIPLSSGSISHGGGDAAAPVFSLLLQDPDNQFVASSVRNELLLSASAGDAHQSGALDEAGRAVRVEACVAEAISRFGLQDLLDRNPHRLSGGEKQRLAMATVWLEKPDVLLLDEPVSFLDTDSRERCVEFVRELNRKGTTVVWASPGGDELLPAATVVYLDGGAVEFAGPRDGFFRYAPALEGKRSLPRLFEIADTLVEMISAGDMRPESASSDSDGAAGVEGPDLITLRDVTFSYTPGETVLESVSAAVPAGECLGIAGPNGSGKTTLLELAAGVLKPSAGTVAFAADARIRAEAGEKRSRMPDRFYLLQSPEQMFFAETVYEEIAYGLIRLGIRSDAHAALISNALSRAGLDSERTVHRSPFRLSFGEMRRLALAIAVSLRPGLLLLDEPSACLDRAGREALQSVLRSWKNEGRTILMASHDIDFLAETCDRIVFLENGSLQGDLRIVRGELPPAAEWPGRVRPLVLELQDALAQSEPLPGRPALSRELFIRRLLSYAETDAPFSNL
jgi:energy-coupling factor transporter ATP-binding protein EcfA2